jgi:putative NADH-flavin reductase
MTLTIFGATGMVGLELVKQALHKEHNVKAFGRNVFTTNFPRNDKLQLVHGALFDEEQVRNAIKGSDAVLSALGGAFDGTDKSRSLGMKNIVEQMEKEKVNRIISIGGMGVLDAPGGGLLMEEEDYPRNYLPVGMEHLKAFRFLEKSSLDWTFVCAPDLINAPVTGVYQTAANVNPPGSKLRINIGDLCLFMLQELEKNQYLQKRVGISN